VAAKVHLWVLVTVLYLSGVQRDETLADFEVARSEWESALGGVPDDALTYLKPGDDYALGGLQVHVNWVLVHYSRVLDAIVARDFAAVPPLDSTDEVEESNTQARAGLTGAQRKEAVERMKGLHAHVSRVVGDIPESDWDRKAPVVYGAGQDPYPTSPSDVIGWLRDHYREHVQQSADLVREAGSPTQGSNIS
jgi:hypothetical protein